MHDLEWTPGCTWHTLATGMGVLWRNKLKPGFKIAGEFCAFIGAGVGLLYVGILTILIYANDCRLTPNAWIAFTFFLGNSIFGAILAAAIITTKREWQNYSEKERRDRWQKVKAKCKSQIGFGLFVVYYIAIVWRLDIGGSWSNTAIALALLPPIALLIHLTAKLARHVCQLGALESDMEH